MFICQYKHNIKEQSNVSKLCAIWQGGNETQEKYVPCFKKVWQYIQKKVDEHEICAIFYESIMLVLNLHAPSAKDISFGVLVQ